LEGVQHKKEGEQTVGVVVVAAEGGKKNKPFLSIR